MAKKLSDESSRPWNVRGDGYPGLSAGGGMGMYGPWRARVIFSVDGYRVWPPEMS